jgi:hypothetical protein
VRSVKIPRDARYFVNRGLLLAGGVFLMFAPDGWPVLGALIIYPTAFFVLLMAYGYVVYKVTERLGANPDDD